MIKLKKGGEPKSLIDNKAAWKKDLLDAIASGGDVPQGIYSRYNSQDVKKALRAECNSKCMYCESEVDHIGYLHIEHIRPKARHKFPELTYEYENLGLACPVCNGNKSDTFDATLPFINPYVDNPPKHFYAAGPFVFAKARDKRAKLTETEIGLNRSALFEARGERIKTLRGLFDEYHREKNATLKAALKAQLLKEIENDKPYSFCGKAFVDALLLSE
jgi:hypothetical protein